MKINFRFQISNFRVIALANEGEEAAELFGIENEYSVGADGWVKLAPYGEHLKERMERDASGRPRLEVYLQRLDRTAAQSMVDRFNSLWGKVKRFIVGVPIYKRHPDLSVYSPGTVPATLANDKTEYGMFAALEAREDGFYGRPVMTSAGQAAIENEGLKFLSPFWAGRIHGEKNGVKIFSPMGLISAGLTDRPNIPGAEALANAKEQHEEGEDQIMKDKIRAALIAAGVVALANDASEEQCTQAIEALGKRAGTAEAALANEKSARTTAEQQAQTEKSAREVAERERNEAKTALANERKARVDLILDQALQEGRITPAQRPQWASELAALAGTAFDEKVKALANEKVQMNTRAQTATLGARKNEADQNADLTQQVVALCNEKMRATQCSYDEAFAAVRREKPELFERMKRPEQQS